MPRQCIYIDCRGVGSGGGQGGRFAPPKESSLGEDILSPHQNLLSVKANLTRASLFRVHKAHGSVNSVGFTMHTDANVGNRHVAIGI
jgi:hypothetical protein